MKDLITTGLLAFLPTKIVYEFLFYMGSKVMDFILGLLKAWKNGNYKSSKMREGIIRWIAELCAILFVIAMDIILGLKFVLCAFTLALFIYKEAGSITENLGECGVNIPSFVKDKLEVFNVEKNGKLSVKIDPSKEESKSE